LRTTPFRDVATTLPPMSRRLHAADAAAILILGVFVGVFGTGLGVAAAHVRSTSSPKDAPLRTILRPGPDTTPSLQRDRVRFHLPP
jgi:hypothetical protein